MTTALLASKPADGRKRQPDIEATKLRSKRVLVVEDDPAVRDSITLLLRIDRHTVVEAANGAEALALAGRQPFDLVVLDFAMPGMLGGEVALKIKLAAPTLPILMVTAYLEKLTEVDKPVDAVLAKPFAVEELRAAVNKLLGL